jgi:hypothetical protein
VVDYIDTLRTDYPAPIFGEFSGKYLNIRKLEDGSEVIEWPLREDM